MLKFMSNSSSQLAHFEVFPFPVIEGQIPEGGVLKLPMVEASAVCAGGAFPGCGTLRGIFQQSTFRKIVLVCALSAKKHLFEKN